MTDARRAHREFAETEYCTRSDWSRARHVIGKAEVTLQGSNSRFVITSLDVRDGGRSGAVPYEEFYCARGEMENRIKEAQFERTLSHAFRANQLWL